MHSYGILTTTQGQQQTQVASCYKRAAGSLFDQQLISTSAKQQQEKQQQEKQQNSNRQLQRLYSSTMTSIMLKAALVLLLALITVSNATHDLNHERYNNERSKLGRLSDGLNVNTRALNTYLKSVNFTSRHLRALVKSLVQIQVFKDEQLPQHSDGIVHDAYEIILTAVVARSCNLVSAFYSQCTQYKYHTDYSKSPRIYVHATLLKIATGA